MMSYILASPAQPGFGVLCTISLEGSAISVVRSPSHSSFIAQMTLGASITAIGNLECETATDSTSTCSNLVVCELSL